MGLFALSAFTIDRRRNEIGLRKALGAGARDIVVQMNREFLSLILIAILLAVPISWYAMSAWLSEFAYKIDLGWTILLLPGFLALAVAVLTVAYQSIKASRLNPVEALRHI